MSDAVVVDAGGLRAGMSVRYAGVPMVVLEISRAWVILESASGVRHEVSRAEYPVFTLLTRDAFHAAATALNQASALVDDLDALTEMQHRSWSSR